ncbi:MAG: OmpA family protein [Bacteroidota bacterium]
MNFRLPGIFIFLFLLNAPVWSMTAPANDDCSRAHVLRDVTNYCSSPRQFTNEGASASTLPGPGCFPPYEIDPDNDVWFKFKATANTVNISVLGAIHGNPKGTLQNPQFALYMGNCKDGLWEIACIGDAQGYNIVETFINDLAIGGTYYIRVDGRNGNTGSFQLCVNNFNPIPSPSSDCSSAVVLCDKSSFTVPSVSGAGRNRFEIPIGICLQEESSSAWYKWTCEQSGSLTFTLKPVNPSDDIDFAVFYLPNGVDDCTEKIPIRCMASGEDVVSSFSKWSRCSGATGLRSSSTDFSEEAGCQDLDDNFVAAMPMEAGASYALLINNFHNTGNGFSIEFGGTGTFKGPVAHFVVNKLKINQSQDLWVKNRSSFEGGINKWEWNFGVDAKPATAKGKGPHKVRYSSSGKKSISLAIETGNGCQITKVRQVTVTDPPPPPPPDPEPAPVQEEKVTEEVLTPKAGEETPPPIPVIGTTSSDPPNLEKAKITALAAPPPPKRDTVFRPVDYLVKYTATVYFASDSFNLEKKDYDVLKKVIDILNQHPGYKAIVEGHTNNIPDDKYCDRLAANRANSVIDYLSSNGIAEDRFIRKVLGKDRVFEKEENKYKNRRQHQKAVIRLMERKED